MKINRLVICLLVLAFSCVNKPVTQYPLWPELKPYQTGYFKVSDLHEIYYQLGGNPQGKAVMVLHGGPGAGCSPEYFRYFNPQVYNIVMHDQRGAGESRPFAEIKENNTQNLVEDIEKLRQFLKLDNVILFGGSWGSTLALAYAETYPQNVSGIVLRGVFTSTQAELDHYYNGAVGDYFPQEYQKLEALTDGSKKNYAGQLVDKMTGGDSTLQAECAKAWAVYEGKIAYLEMADSIIESWFASGWNPLAFSIIENYYMANHCFLEEGQLLNNTDKIADIPCIIINGRYDLICPPVTAYKLHQKLRHSKLVIVERAGHSADEPGIQEQLVKAAHDFEQEW